MKRLGYLYLLLAALVIILMAVAYLGESVKQSGVSVTLRGAVGTTSTDTSRGLTAETGFTVVSVTPAAVPNPEVSKPAAPPVPTTIQLSSSESSITVSASEEMFRARTETLQAIIRSNEAELRAAATRADEAELRAFELGERAGRVNDMEAELARVRQARDDEARRADALARELASHKTEVAAVKVAAAKHETRAGELSRRTQTLEQERTRAEVALAQATRSLQETTAAQQRVQDQLRTQSAQVEAYARELKGAQEKVSRLEYDMAQVRSDVKYWQDVAARLTRENQDIRTAAGQASAQPVTYQRTYPTTQGVTEVRQWSLMRPFTVEVQRYEHDQHGRTTQVTGSERTIQVHRRDSHRPAAVQRSESRRPVRDHAGSRPAIRKHRTSRR